MYATVLQKCCNGVAVALQQCCSAWQCVEIVLQYCCSGVAACCCVSVQVAGLPVLPHVAQLQCAAVCYSSVKCAAVYCSVCSVLSVLQCVAVCCSVLFRVAVCCSRVAGGGPAPHRQVLSLFSFLTCILGLFPYP